MKQTIIALSGRKCAGKNEVGKYIIGYFERMGVSVYQCSFADTLKDFCIETLGLTYEQCYGTDEQKNSSTKYLWENVGDLFLRWRFAGCKWTHGFNTPQTDRYSFWNTVSGLSLHSPVIKPVIKSGPMTAREIMQLFGTDLIRNTFGNVWAEATIRRITNKQCEVSVITDNRFPNEIETVLAQPYGFIIRLTRAPYKGDEHPSEASLDNFSWQRERCFILDNNNMSIEEQNRAVIPVLRAIQERSL